VSGVLFFSGGISPCEVVAFLLSVGNSIFSDAIGSSGTSALSPLKDDDEAGDSSDAALSLLAEQEESRQADNIKTAEIMKHIVFL